MKARTLICMLALAGLVFVGSSTADEKKDPLAGVKCPVSGKPIKEDATVKYKDAKVYFCCQNCPKAFAKNTEKFAAEGLPDYRPRDEGRQVRENQWRHGQLLLSRLPGQIEEGGRRRRFCVQRQGL